MEETPRNKLLKILKKSFTEQEWCIISENDQFRLNAESMESNDDFEKAVETGHKILMTRCGEFPSKGSPRGI